MSTGGPRKQTHISVSKTDKVCCRVETCQEKVSNQNYGRHLERYHPGEDCKDKRPYGVEKFSFGKTKSVVQSENNEENEDTFERKEDINENIELEESTDQGNKPPGSKRPRIEESIDPGIKSPQFRED